MKRLIAFIFLTAFAAGLHRQTVFAQERQPVELSVFAAASLTEALNAVADQYASHERDVKCSFNFAGSQQLAQQIRQGAPADLFLSANMKQMVEASKSGRIDTAASKIFARNRLVVVFPKDNAAGLRSLRDLSAGGLKLVLADKAVPVGEYSLQMLDRCSLNASYGASFRRDVMKNVVSYEENVRVVLSKIVLGEADAGVVYTSDISPHVSQGVGTIEIPDEFNVIASYPAAVVLDSKHLDRAGKFLSYLLSDEGQAVLARFGFMPIARKGAGK